MRLNARITHAREVLVEKSSLVRVSPQGKIKMMRLKCEKLKIRRHDTIEKLKDKMHLNREMMQTAAFLIKDNSFLNYYYVKEFGSKGKFIEACYNDMKICEAKIKMMQNGAKYIPPKKRELKKEAEVRDKALNPLGL